LLAYEQDDFPLATEYYRKALDKDPAFALPGTTSELWSSLAAL